ncbi:MAG: F-type H+-transporting ATPase subunit b [Frankiales bacterium]|nr:F-type H+-transporting ATPase subunit b [Frankiales bacterium]
MAFSALTSVALLAAEDEPNPLVPHTSELIVGTVAFILLFLLLRKMVFPMFEKAFAERTAAIEGGIAKAEKAQAAADEALHSYQQQLAEAREEAGRIRTNAQSERAAIVEEARVEARAEATRITEAATAQIAAERQQALAELRREVGTLAVDLASRIVGESLEDEARQRGTVDRYLTELEAAPAGGAV